MLASSSGLHLVQRRRRVPALGRSAWCHARPLRHQRCLLGQACFTPGSMQANCEKNFQSIKNYFLQDYFVGKESVTERFRIACSSVKLTWYVCYVLASVVPVTHETLQTHHWSRAVQDTEHPAYSWTRLRWVPPHDQAMQRTLSSWSKWARITTLPEEKKGRAGLT